MSKGIRGPRDQERGDASLESEEFEEGENGTTGVDVATGFKVATVLVTMLFVAAAAGVILGSYAVRISALVVLILSGGWLALTAGSVMIMRIAVRKLRNKQGASWTGATSLSAGFPICISVAVYGLSFIIFALLASTSDDIF